jgi:hypothetical protein
MAEWKSLLDDAKLEASEQFKAAWKLHVDKVSDVLESGWRENISRIVEQRFDSLKSELTTANEEWLAHQVEERVAARLNEEWEAQIGQQVENRLSAEFDERVAHKVEEQMALRMEEEVGARLEQEVQRRVEEILPVKVEAGIAAQIEERLEASVSDRVVALLPDRVEEVLALRLAEELPGRIAQAVNAEKEKWDAEFLPLVDQAKQETVIEAAAAAEEAASKARNAGRHELGQQLGQSLRVLRVAGDGVQWRDAVLDAAAPFCALTALFLVTKDRYTLEGVRGMAGELETIFELEFHEAAAFQNAHESKDLVVSLRGDSEVSPYVMSLRPEIGEGKSYVFPVMVQDQVAALLYIEPKEEEPLEIGAIETIVTAAGLGLHSIRAARAVQTSSLVNIATALNPFDGRPFDGRPFDGQPSDGGLNELRFEPVAVGAAEVAVGANGVAPVLPDRGFSWDDLTQEERENHMRAQRFARTQVAEMRLYKDEAVKSGRRDGNIYLRLKEEVDAARERYQSQFLDGQTHMRDYLHAELVETLAIDNPQLMGPDYPGALV